MARLVNADEFMKNFEKEIENGATDVFDAVENALEETPTIEPKHEWISVKDRLPEVGQKVLVCDVGPDSDYGIKVLSLECDEKGTYWDDGDGWWFEPEDMSHWMPLPEPPEREGE